MIRVGDLVATAHDSRPHVVLSFIDGRTRIDNQHQIQWEAALVIGHRNARNVLVRFAAPLLTVTPIGRQAVEQHEFLMFEGHRWTLLSWRTPTREIVTLMRPPNFIRLHACFSDVILQNQKEPKWHSK